MQKGEQIKNNKEWFRIQKFVSASGWLIDEEINKGKPPEPDFIIGSRELIGVEVTDIYYPVDEVGFARKHFENESELIVEMAEKEFRKFSLKHELAVDVSFTDYSGTTRHSSDFILQKSDRNYLARSIAEVVALNLPEPDRHVTVERYNYYGERVLPEKIDYISITNYTKKFEGLWSPSFSGCVPGLEKKHIDAILSKKNTRPKNYKGHYKEICLLMIFNKGSFSSDFHLNEIETLKQEFFVTPFDKLFVFHLWDNAAIQLKTINE